MQTIDRQCLTREWILRKAAEMAPVEPVQLERCILAFELLGRLADAGIPFIFKGGTAVLLRLKNLRRLSVDMDISCQYAPGKLERELDEIGRRPPFLGCEERQRRSPPLPKKRHFYFRFKSAVTGDEGHVIVDVLEEDDLYPVVEEVPVAMPFFILDHRVIVPVPTAEGLLGDKLTAFAPTTVGLPYDPESPVDLIKQLFDISQLFDTVTRLDTVIAAYHRVFEAENRYRGNRFTVEQALEDTYQASLTLAAIDLTKGFDPQRSALLKAGVANIAPLLVQSDFKLSQAKVAAGKAALLTRLIRANRREVDLPSLRFNPQNLASLQGILISRPLEYLNKLKGVSPEAFHYWHKVQSLE